MYKKLLPLLTLTFILVATPVLASQNGNPDKPQNHGFFVSAEAHEHEGGDDVSAVAKSSLGKHDDEDENDDIDEDDNIHVSPNPSASPSPTPSTSPSPTPTPTPSGSPAPSTSPSPTPTPTPTPTVGANINVNTNVIQGLIDQLKNLVTSLENLLS